MNYSRLALSVAMFGLAAAATAATPDKDIDPMAALTQGFDRITATAKKDFAQRYRIHNDNRTYWQPGNKICIGSEKITLSPAHFVEFDLKGQLLFPGSAPGMDSPFPPYVRLFVSKINGQEPGILSDGKVTAGQDYHLELNPGQCFYGTTNYISQAGFQGPDIGVDFVFVVGDHDNDYQVTAGMGVYSKIK